MNSRGEMEIEVLGKKYPMKGDFECLSRMEAMLGTSLPSVFLRASKMEVTLKDVVTILFCGCQAGSAKFKKDYNEFGTMVLEHGYSKMITPALTFLDHSLYPNREKEKKTNEEEEENSQS